MSKVDNVIASLQENVDGENIIAFGIVADLTTNPCEMKGYAVGREGRLVEAVANMLDDKQLRELFSKALALRVRDKMSKITFNSKNHEKRHKEYN